MAIPLSYSAAARRTGDSPISDLMARALANPDLISLAAGFVDHATLPTEAAFRAVEAVLGDEIEGRRALQYGTTRGDWKLRHRLAERLERDGEIAPGSAAEVQQRLVVTSGSQQLLYLVCEALIDPGDIVLVESPTYFVFLGLLQSFGARAIGVETDEDGLRVDALEETLADLDARGLLDRVKLIYTVTEHSNPTGLCLAAERRPALVEAARRWSREGRIIILEDAAYRGLTFDGPEPPTLLRQDLDGEHVVHARTFSKTFSPGLKTGYGVLPRDLAEAVLHLKGNHDFGSAHFNQQLLEQVLADGSYDRQVVRLAETYRRKRDMMLGALETCMAPFEGLVSWTRPRGGLYVWMSLPEGIDTGRDGPLFERCVSEGVLYVPGALAYPAEPGAPPKHHARLSFGVVGEEGLVEGIRRLSVALAECLEPAAR